VSSDLNHDIDKFTIEFSTLVIDRYSLHQECHFEHKKEERLFQFRILAFQIPRVTTVFAALAGLTVFRTWFRADKPFLRSLLFLEFFSHCRHFQDYKLSENS
jgi:hypothetical protein